MQAIYFALAIGLVWLHFAALAAFVGPHFGSWAIGRAVAVTVIVTFAFFVEHLSGLGPLRFVWPFSALIASFYLWCERDALKKGGFVQAEAVFGAALAYGLIWRCLFPSIYQTAERLPDLMFISSFIDGSTLPVQDHWLPPFKFDYYYTLQYYAAGFAGRVFQMPLGLTYNLSVAFLAALSLSLVWDTGSRFIRNRFSLILLMAALAFGGTGVTILNHIIVDSPTDIASTNERMWGSARFIGEYDQHINTDIGHKLFPPGDDPGVIPRSLGMENLGYQYFLGEFHAPQGGYFLLLLAVALIAAMEFVPDDDKSRKRLVHTAMGFSVPVVLAVNTWVLPLQGLLLGTWAVWRAWQGRAVPGRKPDWAALIAGGVVGTFLLYPFLSGFANRGMPTPIRLVFPGDHTPVPQFIALFWPLLVLIALGLWHRETRRLTLFFALVFGGLLVMSEMIFVDDPSAGQFERSNTTMKWWGWIWTGGLTALGAVLLAAKARWMRYLTMFALGCTVLYGYDIVQFWRLQHEQGNANMYGSSFYTTDPVARDMFRYLAQAPDGIMLENQYADGYHEGGAYSAFSGKPLFVGWTNQLYNWRGYMDVIGNRRRETNQFYSGEMQQPLSWAADNELRYIVWNRRDTQPPGLWDKRNGELSPLYVWKAFGTEAGKPVGIWVRRERQ
ncbi:MAG TPA: DUF2298 domain-containing protein [Burkholderiaceae bacterium]